MGRSDIEAAGSMAIMAAASVVVVASAAASVPLLLALMLVVVLATSPSPSEEFELFYLWVPFALYGSIHNLTSGMEVVNNPRFKDLAVLLGISALFLMSFWFVWPST